MKMKQCGVKHIFSLFGSLFIMNIAQAATLYHGTCAGTAKHDIDVEWCWGDDDQHTIYTSFGVGELDSIMPGTHNIQHAEVDGPNHSWMWSVSYKVATATIPAHWALRSLVPSYYYRGTCQENPTPITGAASHAACKQQIRTDRKIQQSIGG